MWLKQQITENAHSKSQPIAMCTSIEVIINGILKLGGQSKTICDISCSVCAAAWDV